MFELRRFLSKVCARQHREDPESELDFSRYAGLWLHASPHLDEHRESGEPRDVIMRLMLPPTRDSKAIDAPPTVLGSDPGRTCAIAPVEARITP